MRICIIGETNRRKPAIVFPVIVIQTIAIIRNKLILDFSQWRICRSFP
jgi:hypothetical protein